MNYSATSETMKPTITEAFVMQNRLISTTLNNKLVSVILELPIRLKRQQEKQRVFCFPSGTSLCSLR